MDEKYGLLFWSIVIGVSVIINIQKIQDGWKFFLFAIFTFFAIYNYNKLCTKYFTDTILNTPEVPPKYVEFLTKNSDCKNIILVYTKNSKWIPSAQIAKCSNSKLEKWTTRFSYSNELIKPLWVIKYEN